jgi:hypothetical protein
MLLSQREKERLRSLVLSGDTRGVEPQGHWMMEVLD